MKVQFINNDKGQPTGVFLTMKQYESLMEKLEELDEIRAYDRAKQHQGQSRPFAEFLQEIKVTQS